MSFRGIFRDIFLLEIIIAGAVFLIIVVLLAVTLYRRRAGAGRGPSSRADNLPLEIGYAVALLGIAVFLVVVTANANQRQEQVQQAARAAPDVARVDVNGFQWCWEFSHRDGPARETGTCQADPATRPTLVVPVGRPVELRLTSRDVVHALWVPDLALKSDVYPDHTNVLATTFDHAGTWLGRCSEFCGTHHPTMEFWVRAVPEQEYQQYLASGGASV
jgi:cytochrome c oxidase subunit II